MLAEPLPESLRREGEMMRNALLTDLTECSDIEITVMRDPRCAAFVGHPAAQWIMPRSNENTIAFYRRILQNADCVWPIAPESNGALMQLAAIARSAEKHVLLSDAATLAICSSKYATYRALHAFGINAVETFRAGDGIQNRNGRWIVKPDDGAGAQGIGLYGNIHAALQACSASNKDSCVLQPWCDGEALSISLLCAQREARLLSVNRQQVRIENSAVAVTALQVNALPNDAEIFVALGARIAAALPGLCGYIGVDLIRAANDELHVLEINPRLTTSYCALRHALGINVARLVLQLHNDGQLPSVERKKNMPIDLDLAMTYA